MYTTSRSASCALHTKPGRVAGSCGAWWYAKTGPPEDKLSGRRDALNQALCIQGMTGLPLLPSRASVDVSPPHPSASVAGHFIMWILVQIATAREAAKGAKGDGGGVRQEAVSGISGQSAILSV